MNDERSWDDERSAGDAPVWMNDEQASGWAAGWNAAVRACVEQQNESLTREQS